MVLELNFDSICCLMNLVYYNKELISFSIKLMSNNLFDNKLYEVTSLCLVKKNYVLFGFSC